MNPGPQNSRKATESSPLAKALDEFIEQHSYPAEAGLIVRQVARQPVHHRADRGNAAAYFAFSEIHDLEAHVSEIAPGEQTKKHRHTCEAFFFVLTGDGYSVIQSGSEGETRVSWQQGDLFVTPQNCWHWHANSDPVRPARYLEITTIPLMKARGTWSIEPAADADDR